MASGCEMGGRGPKPRFHGIMRPLPKANRTRGGHGAAFPSLDPNPSPHRHHRDQSRQAKTPMVRCRVGMASGLEMGGRGPQPHFHRTARPLPKANRAGGGHGAAFPPPDPNPRARTGTTETTVPGQARTPIDGQIHRY